MPYALLLIALGFLGPDLLLDDAIKVRVPLNAAGEAELGAILSGLARAAGVDAPKLEGPVNLPIRGVAGALSRKLLAETLGPAVGIEPGDAAVMFRLGPQMPPPDGDLARRLGELADYGRREVERRARYGMRPLRSYRPNDDDRPTICLVHGINSTSGVFVHMIPLLEQAGFGLVVYDFPYNRDLRESSAAFVRDWEALRKAQGEKRPWSIVAHSMGSLLARSYVEGERFAGDVDHLIMLGPVNQGSRLAQVQTLLQWVEGVQAVNGRKASLLGHLGDGLGEAADDLLPGSRYLVDLNARPRRAGIDYHILAGDAGFLTVEGRERIDARVAAIGKTSPLLGNVTRLTLGDLPARLDELTDGKGDGCMTVEATRLDGVPDHEILHANHVELIRGPGLYPDPGPVVSMPFILSRLGRGADQAGGKGR